MPFPDQANLSNHLLRAVSPDDYLFLQPNLRLASFVVGQVVFEPNSPVERLLFPESGFVSMVTEGARQIEVGLVGREGLVGATPLLLGGNSTPYRHNVQYAGEMIEVAANVLDEAVDRSPALRKLLLRFVQVLLVQTAQTAYVNAVLDVETRLARWLLMCRDRLDTDDLQLTHEFLSMMLGVQRTSVTLALQSLEGGGTVWARRGRIKIRDRDLLRQVAGEGYGVPEAEYARLIAPS